MDNDRRFYHEQLDKIETHTSVELPHVKKLRLNKIPPGTYDVEEGYYEPIYSIIYTYDGKILRTPPKKEVDFIMSKCRYNPNKLDYKITGVKIFIYLFLNLLGKWWNSQEGSWIKWIK